MNGKFKEEKLIPMFIESEDKQLAIESRKSKANYQLKMLGQLYLEITGGK